VTTRTQLAIDKTVTLDINGSTQRIRMCAEHLGLRPLLVVQAGPGLPMLHEVAKFQTRLHLERDFLVAYWEQRGCGPAPQQDAATVSMQQQVDDLRSVMRWFRAEVQQPAVVLGISLGATFVLRAVESEPDFVKAVVVVSADAQAADSDAAADAFIQQESPRAGGRLRRRALKLAKPPYTDPAEFQRRTRLLADLGAIERGRSFADLFRETLFSLIRTYGIAGAITSLRNMNLVQRRMLPELASLDLIATPPRVTVPVHYIYGERDALMPAAIVHGLPAAIAAPASSVAVVPNAGHQIHFDAPDIVRSITVRA